MKHREAAADLVLTKSSPMRNHQVKRKSQMPTVADVARLAGVGAITVSRAVNETSYVSEEKKKRIRDAIKKLGYRPNQAARVLKGNRAKVIGLIIPDLADLFFGRCAAAVEEYASSRGYMTLIVASNRNQELQESAIAMMIGQNVAGLIVVPSLPGESFRQLSAADAPIVALDRPLEGAIADEVVVENLGGAQTAVNHLIEQHGHKRIACVGYDKSSYTIGHRILGYNEAMRAHRLKPEIYDGVESLDDTLKLVRRWKKSQDRPTGIFSLNNVSTRHLLWALREVELAIPQKMALIGFDDLELAALLSPPLTVVRQPAVNLGVQASKLLFERIAAGEQPEGGFGIKLVLPVEFVIRASCGCPPVKPAYGRSCWSGSSSRRLPCVV
jgi:LacI family transcriptional regulator